MKRRDFFKRISLGAAAVVVAPSVVKGVSEEVKDQEWIEVDLSDRDIRKYPMTYDEAYTLTPITITECYVADNNKQLHVSSEQPMVAYDQYIVPCMGTNSVYDIKCVSVGPFGANVSKGRATVYSCGLIPINDDIDFHFHFHKELAPGDKIYRINPYRNQNNLNSK